MPVPPARRETYSWSAETAGPEGYAKLTDAIQLAVLINPPTPTAEQATRLREFVEAGGGLWIFPGPRTDGPAFTSAWEAGWLPASMEAVTDAPADGLAWESRGFSHPVTDFWNDDRMGDLGLVRTIRRLPLAPADGENASQAIAAYADGSPAIVEGGRGNGRVVLFDSTATTEWTTLPLHPSFVALVSRLAGYTTSSSEERMQLLAGEPYRTTSSIDWLGREFRLLRVGDSEGPRTGGKVELDEERSADPPTSCGFPRMRRRAWGSGIISRQCGGLHVMLPSAALQRRCLWTRRIPPIRSLSLQCNVLAPARASTSAWTKPTAGVVAWVRHITSASGVRSCKVSRWIASVSLRIRLIEAEAEDGEVEEATEPNDPVVVEEIPIPADPRALSTVISWRPGSNTQLTPGQSFEFWIEATDRNPVEGEGHTTSSPQRMQIVTTAEKLQEIKERMEQGAGRAREISESQDELREELSRTESRAN